MTTAPSRSRLAHAPAALLPLLLGLAASACDDGGGSVSLDDAAPVLARHAALVHDSYADAVDGAAALQTAVDAFVAAPSQATLDAARTAWIASRVAYRQTEVYRFYGGPIDAADNDVELRINSWPLDEVYIDYVDGMPTAGIINDTVGVPSISAQILGERNMMGSESNVSLGYHAVEFLLWGQDQSASGPGARPFTDYVEGMGGTAANQARRGEYLALAADLLVADLTAVRDAWAEGASYRAAFIAAAPADALGRVLTGVGAMAASELSGERIITAYENKDQEDEHSCFSDTTIDDIAGNFQGIENVYLGNYGGTDGAGLDDLVAARDPALDAKVKADLAAAKAAIAAIPGPFDQAILGDDSADGRVKVLAAARAIQAVGDSLVDVATELGITINVDL